MDPTFVSLHTIDGHVVHGTDAITTRIQLPPASDLSDLCDTWDKRRRCRGEYMVGIGVVDRTVLYFAILVKTLQVD